jgi:predicted porin
VFQLGVRYTIGPWKLYGGYEHLSFSNPNNPLQPGATAIGGYNIAFVNNNNYVTDRNQDVFWVGAKYAITPALDIAASYYGIRQHFFTQGAAPAAGVAFANVPGGALNLGSLAAQQVACASNSASQTNCAGGEDMVGLVMDWRFARHVDLYAGIAYSQRNGGLAAGFVTSNGNAAALATCNTGGPCNLKTTVSTFDPGVGLRYQF